MKLKKIAAIMLSVSMLACLSACGSEDSSSSKKDKEIQTETVAVDNSSAEDEISRLESDNSDLESEMSALESKSSSLDSDTDSNADLGDQSLEDLMNNYDNEHPEETIIAVLKAGFEASFGENMNITYDEKDSNYTISVWQKGFAAALDTEAGASAINSLSSSLESSLEQMTTQIRMLDSDANVTFNFVSDEDNDKILLTLYNGKMTYSITEE